MASLRPPFLAFLALLLAAGSAQAAIDPAEGPAYTLSLPAVVPPPPKGKVARQPTLAQREGEFLAVIHGEVRFNVAEDDFASVAGAAIVTQVWRRHVYKIEYRADGDYVRRLFFIDGVKMDFGDDGRLWLAQAIPLFLREAGWQVHERSQRLLVRGGPALLLDEIERIKSPISRSLHLQELLQSGRLQRAELDRAVVIGAGLKGDALRREATVELLARQNLDTAHKITLAAGIAAMYNDGEKRPALEALAPRMTADPLLLRAWQAAFSSLALDAEKRAALVALSQVAEPAPAMLAAVLEDSRHIRSDFERAHVLALYAGPVASQAALVPAFTDSAHAIRAADERRIALAALARTGKLDAMGYRSVLEAAADMGNDAALREVLVTVGAQMPRDADLLRLYRQLARGLAENERRLAEGAIARFEG